MNEPVIITRGKRRAVVHPDRVSLLKLGNKKKPQGVWPETKVHDELEGLHAGLMWCMKGFIDVPGAK